MVAVCSSSDENSETSDDNYTQVGLSSSSNGDYIGQAIGSYSPFLISGDSSSDLDAVSDVLRSNNCSISNPAGASGVIPTGNCNTNMNGILVARNKNFFNFEQNLLQSFSQNMSKNGWASATSTLDGSVLNGTAGHPQQDSDGVWRWYISPLSAPSFPTPSGTLLNSGSTTINKGDYFVVQGEVPANSDGVTKGIGATVTNISGVPTTIGWKNGGAINGSSTTSAQSVSNNNYGYSCSVGDYEGYDSSTGNLKYSMFCTVNVLPPPPTPVASNDGTSCSEYTPDNDVETILKSHNVRYGAVYSGSEAPMSVVNPQKGSWYGGFNRIAYYHVLTDDRRLSQPYILNKCISNTIFSRGVTSIPSKFIANQLYDVPTLTPSNLDGYMDQVLPLDHVKMAVIRYTGALRLGPMGYGSMDANYLTLIFENHFTQLGIGNNWGQFTQGFYNIWGSDRPNILFIYTNNLIFGSVDPLWGALSEYDYLTQAQSRNFFVVFIVPRKVDLPLTTGVTQINFSYGPEQLTNVYRNLDVGNVIQLNVQPGQEKDGQLIYDSIYKSPKFLNWIHSWR